VILLDAEPLARIAPSETFLKNRQIRLFRHERRRTGKRPELRQSRPKLQGFISRPAFGVGRRGSAGNTGQEDEAGIAAADLPLDNAKSFGP
jgi:hypothetical protein